MAGYPPKKNAAFTVYLPILDADGDPVAGAAALSSTISGDGAAFAAGPTPVDKGEGFYSIALSAAQMNFDNIAGVLKTTTGGAKNTPFSIYTSTRQLDDLAFPNVSGRGIDVDTLGGVEADVTRWLTATPDALSAGKVPADVKLWLAVAPSALNAGLVQADVERWLNAVPNALLQGRVPAHTGTAVGTADSGTTTTVVDAERTEADTDYWVGALLLFTSGTLIGQTRLVTAFNPATDTLTFAPATTVAVGTQTYILLPAGRADVQLWLGALVNALIAGRVDTSVGAMAADVVTAAAIATDAIGAAEFAQGAADKVWSSATRTLTAFSTALALSVWDVLDTSILTAGSVGLRLKGLTFTIASKVDASIQAAGDFAQAAADKVWLSTTRSLTDKTGFSIGTGGIAAAAFAAGAIDAAALAASAGQEIADEVLNRDIAGGASGGTRNVRSALRALRNRRAIAAGTLTVYQEDDTTAAWTAVVTTTAGNPVSQIDPA